MALIYLSAARIVVYFSLFLFNLMETPIASISEIQIVDDHRADKDKEKRKTDQICQWINELTHDEKRENSNIRPTKSSIR